MTAPIVEAKPLILHAEADPLDVDAAIAALSGTDGFTDFTEAADIIPTTEFFGLWAGIIGVVVPAA